MTKDSTKIPAASRRGINALSKRITRLGLSLDRYKIRLRALEVLSTVSMGVEQSTTEEE